MTATIPNTQPHVHLDRLQQVRHTLDDALDHRSRLNRRIKRLRAAQEALQEGRVPPLLDDLLQEGRPAPTAAPPAPAAAAPAAAPTASSGWGPQLVPPAESSLVGHFGAPMGPSELPGLSGPPTGVPSRLDVGTLQQLSEGELNGLPFGVITLDRTGRIVGYNDTESRMVGLPKDAVIGRDFFGEVAPCAKVRAFEGRFQDLVNSSQGFPMTSFDFVFRFAAGAQHVSIMISPARHRGRFHVSMFRR